MTRRADEQAKRIQSAEQTAPLRRRILEALRDTRRTTRDLAAELEVRAESVSRIVTDLRAEGMLESETDRDDKRQRHHSLTAAGETELSRYFAYGAPQHDLVEPSHRQRSDFLYSALEAAVLMRRETHQLEDAATRISVVLREARKLGDGGLVVEAISELATTLRQIPTEDSEVEPLLDELEAISLGKGPVAKPTLAMPAIAHREYALGRLGEHRDSEEERRERHLIVAANLYQQLAAAPYHLEPAKWRERQGWGLIGLARILHMRSRFEDALVEAAKALRLFEEIENPYGRAHCQYVFGNCLRLLGDFEGAWTWLKDAQAVAEEHSYERFRAKLLWQMGEVMRCRGQIEDAQAALEESRDRADAMGLKVVRAFAYSALGGVAFHRRDLQRAELELGRAHIGFDRLGHRSGLALNGRREGAVARLRYEETRKNLENAERKTSEAQEYYLELGSPAGVAACQIEQGRLRIVSGGGANGTVGELVDLIENQKRTSEKSLVELDPWVPGLMSTFAEEVEIEPFIAQATGLRETGRERLRRRATLGLQEAAELMGVSEPPAAPVSIGGETADEMGGETRQVAGPGGQWALV